MRRAARLGILTVGELPVFSTGGQRHRRNGPPKEWAMNTVRSDPPLRAQRLLFGGARSAADLPPTVTDRVRREVARLASGATRAGSRTDAGVSAGHQVERGPIPRQPAQPTRPAQPAATAVTGTAAAPSDPTWTSDPAAPADAAPADAALEAAVTRTLATVYDLADIDPILVAMDAWRTCHTLAGEARLPAVAGPGDCRVVDFGPRGVTHTRAQAVRVSLGGRPLGTIRFTVSLTLDVALMAAALEEDRLRRVGLHGCRLTVTLAAGDEPLCSASRRVDFPRSFGLGTGLPSAPTGGGRR
jgi:hypothetical protein